MWNFYKNFKGQPDESDRPLLLARTPLVTDFAERALPDQRKELAFFSPSYDEGLPFASVRSAAPTHEAPSHDATPRLPP